MRDKTGEPRVNLKVRLRSLKTQPTYTVTKEVEGMIGDHYATPTHQMLHSCYNNIIYLHHYLFLEQRAIQSERLILSTFSTNI